VLLLVLGYEVWTPLQPNAILDITEAIDAKLQLVDVYETQTSTIDYRNLCDGMAKVRAFHAAVRPDRGGAAEAFVALPSPDYCDIVAGSYGGAGRLTTQGMRMLE
jgi:hypothetical protein